MRVKILRTRGAFGREQTSEGGRFRTFTALETAGGRRKVCIPEIVCQARKQRGCRSEAGVPRTTRGGARLVAQVARVAATTKTARRVSIVGGVVKKEGRDKETEKQKMPKESS